MPQVPQYPAAAQNPRFIISYQSNAYPYPLSTTVYSGSGVREGNTVTHTLRSLTRNTEYDVQIRAQVQFSACSVSMSGASSGLMTFRTNNTCAYVACFHQLLLSFIVGNQCVFHLMWIN